MPINCPTTSIASKFINRQNTIVPNKFTFCLFSSAQGSANSSPLRKKDAIGITTATTVTTATTPPLKKNPLAVSEISPVKIKAERKN